MEYFLRLSFCFMANLAVMSIFKMSANPPPPPNGASRIPVIDQAKIIQIYASQLQAIRSRTASNRNQQIGFSPSKTPPTANAQQVIKNRISQLKIKQLERAYFPRCHHFPNIGNPMIATYDGIDYNSNKTDMSGPDDMPPQRVKNKNFPGLSPVIEFYETFHPEIHNFRGPAVRPLVNRTSSCVAMSDDEDEVKDKRNKVQRSLSFDTVESAKPVKIVKINHLFKRKYVTWDKIIGYGGWPEKSIHPVYAEDSIPKFKDSYEKILSLKPNSSAKKVLKLIHSRSLALLLIGGIPEGSENNLIKYKKPIKIPKSERLTQNMLTHNSSPLISYHSKISQFAFEEKLRASKLIEFATLFCNRYTIRMTLRKCEQSIVYPFFMLAYDFWPYLQYGKIPKPRYMKKKAAVKRLMLKNDPSMHLRRQFSQFEKFANDDLEYYNTVFNARWDAKLLPHLDIKQVEVIINQSKKK